MPTPNSHNGNAHPDLRNLPDLQDPFDYFSQAVPESDVFGQFQSQDYPPLLSEHVSLFSSPSRPRVVTGELRRTLEETPDLNPAVVQPQLSGEEVLPSLIEASYAESLAFMPVINDLAIGRNLTTGFAHRNLGHRFDDRDTQNAADAAKGTLPLQIEDDKARDSSQSAHCLRRLRNAPRRQNLYDGIADVVNPLIGSSATGQRELLSSSALSPISSMTRKLSEVKPQQINHSDRSSPLIHQLANGKSDAFSISNEHLPDAPSDLATAFDASKHAQIPYTMANSANIWNTNHDAIDHSYPRSPITAREVTRYVPTQGNLIPSPEISDYDPLHISSADGSRMHVSPIPNHLPDNCGAPGSIQDDKPEVQGQNIVCDVLTKKGDGSLEPRLEDHYTCIRIEDPVECDVCDKTFFSHEEVERHKSKSHGPKEDFSPFQCDECNLAFKNHANHMRHIYTAHTGDTKYKCSMCPASFSTNKSCVSHEKKAHQKDPISVRKKKQVKLNRIGKKKDLMLFICKKCGYRSTVKSNTTRHIKIVHLEERPFKCTFPGCNVTAKTKHNLQIHESRHSGTFA